MTGAQLFAIVSVKGAAASVSALKSVSGAVNSTQSSLNKIGTGTGQLALGLTKIAVAGAAAGIGGLAVAAKTSIDFADAFAGVRKTVAGSPAELDALYKQLENLSTRIPVSFQDLADMAQEAGALGVPTDKVAGFAEAVARVTAATVGLDEATASEAFGKLGNIFGLGNITNGYEKLGSVLIELGNTGASTEGDIIEVAQRFGAAGKAAGLSAAQVLAWSSAIASLGPQAQAAGNALQLSFQRMLADAGLGNDAFKVFAKTAGMSTKAFKELVGKDSSDAMQAFLVGLNKQDKLTQQVTLKQAGLGSVRVSQGVLLLAQNQDLLNSALTTSNTAWTQNNALTDVSNKRFDTLKSKLAELKNTGLVALADIGEGITPALGRLADRFQTFLTSHEADFTKIGRDVGDAIDSIDWSKVEHGAETLYGLLKDGLEVLKKIPPEVDLAVAGFLGLNKVSGGLLSAGLSNIASGAVGTLTSGLTRGIASKVPGLGNLVSTPVYVTGVAPGVNFGPKSGPTPPGGAPEAGLLATIAKVAGPIAFAALNLFSDSPQFHNTNPQTSDEVNARAQDIARAIDYYRKQNPTALVNPGSGITTTNAQMVAQLTEQLAQLNHTLTPSALPNVLNAAGHAPVPGSLGSQSFIDAAIAASKAQTDATKAGTSTLGAKLDALHQDFYEQRASLKKAVDPATILAAAQKTTKDLLAGVGNVGATRDLLNTLKTQELKVTDPTQRKLMDQLIRQTETKLASRQQIDSMLSKDTTLINQGSLSRSVLSRIHSDEQTLRSHGDSHAAAELVKLEQIRAKQLKAELHLTSNQYVTLDGRVVAHDVVKWTGVPFHSVGRA